jgi:hypothetical protein
MARPTTFSRANERARASGPVPGLGQKLAAYMGCDAAHSISSFRTNPTVTHYSGTNKTGARVSSHKPSAHLLILALSHMSQDSATDGRPSDGRRMTAPPRTPSPTGAPTNGWTCHRQAAPRWGPTHVHPPGSRSGGGPSPRTAPLRAPTV